MDKSSIILEIKQKLDLLKQEILIKELEITNIIMEDNN